VPATRLTVVPNAAHLSNVEQPGFVTAAMLEFLMELEASAPVLTSHFTTF
jgi:pimeloyl-ACP methyl ester carboxylesterase